MCIKKIDINVFQGFLDSYLDYNSVKVESVKMSSKKMEVCISSDDGDDLAQSLKCTKQLFNEYFDDGYSLDVECIADDDEHMVHICRLTISRN